MKGLLIKDLKLAIKQKAVFIILLFMALFMLLGNEDPVFGICYGMFLTVIILVGTVGYDDYDNGMSFLMTLPVSRKTYAVEKYVLSLTGTLISGGVITFINVIYVIERPDIMSMAGLLECFVVAYCICAVIASVYLPFQLKYGAEKGRLVLVALAGVIFAAVFFLNKILPSLETGSGGFAAVFAAMGNISAGAGLLIGVAITVIAVLVSIKMSIGILEKEEY